MVIWRNDFKPWWKNISNINESQHNYKNLQDLEKAIKQLKKEMQRAAKELDFILAASIRDQIIALEKLKDSFLWDSYLYLEFWQFRKEFPISPLALLCQSNTLCIGPYRITSLEWATDCFSWHIVFGYWS